MILLWLLAGCGVAWDGTWIMSLVVDEDDRSGTRTDVMTSFSTLEDGTVLVQSDRFALSGLVQDEQASFAFESRYARTDGGCDQSWVTARTLAGTLSYGVFDGSYVESQTTSSCDTEEVERTPYVARGARLDGDPGTHLPPVSGDTGWP
ncbi:MAG: hypothetical protein EXR71_01125 [Myxococcales bacterium]|nr:hypothetical protein [Myxococcales bacterium]